MTGLEFWIWFVVYAVAFVATVALVRLWFLEDSADELADYRWPIDGDDR